MTATDIYTPARAIAVPGGRRPSGRRAPSRGWQIARYAALVLAAAGLLLPFYWMVVASL
jgi:multiple sugar transport system permease protein